MHHLLIICFFEPKHATEQKCWRNFFSQTAFWGLYHAPKFTKSCMHLSYKWNSNIRYFKSLVQNLHINLLHSSLLFHLYTWYIASIQKKYSSVLWVIIQSFLSKLYHSSPTYWSCHVVNNRILITLTKGYNLLFHWLNSLLLQCMKYMFIISLFLISSSIKRNCHNSFW